MDTTRERGSYEIVGLSETINISADRQQNSCCLRRTPGCYHTHIKDTSVPSQVNVSTSWQCWNRKRIYPYVYPPCIKQFSLNIFFNSDFNYNAGVKIKSFMPPPIPLLCSSSVSKLLLGEKAAQASSSPVQLKMLMSPDL